jgi:putative phosphoesterase
LNRSEEFLIFWSRIKKVFSGVNHIIHAGDVVCEELITLLETLSPVSVVCGNMDKEEGITKWSKILTIELGGKNLAISHKLQDLYSIPLENVDVLISGHTHIPSIQEDPNGKLLINPGSARLPRPIPKKMLFEGDITPRPTLGILSIENDLISAFIKRI